MKTQIIEIKTGSTPINQIVEAVQGDSGRVLRCIISDMSIPVGSTARFYAVKPSGAEIYNDCAIDGQAVVLNMTTQMLAEVGTLNGQIEVTNSGKTVTSFSFCVNVIKNIKSNSAIESSNEFTALEEALRKAEEVADPLINFEEAAEREILTTGERLSVLVGKISKWIKDLKKAAFYDVANNVTTATAGTSVLDAYQGKLLKEQLDELNTNLFLNKTFTDSWVVGFMVYGMGLTVIIPRNYSTHTLSISSVEVFNTSWFTTSVETISLHPNGWRITLKTNDIMGLENGKAYLVKLSGTIS